jgi:hypothetical protein
MRRTGHLLSVAGLLRPELLRTPSMRSSQKAPQANIRLCGVALLGHHPRSARHGSVARSRLHFLGYVTVYPRHCATVSPALARLSPTPAARRRTPIALHGTAPPRSSCFVQVNQDPRYLPECVKGKFCELRLHGVLRSSAILRTRA